MSQAWGVATAALASKDQNLKQAYDTVMNPARTFDFIQKIQKQRLLLNNLRMVIMTAYLQQKAVFNY